MYQEKKIAWYWWYVFVGQIQNKPKKVALFGCWPYIKPKKWWKLSSHRKKTLPRGSYLLLSLFWNQLAQSRDWTSRDPSAAFGPEWGLFNSGSEPGLHLWGKIKYSALPLSLWCTHKWFSRTLREFFSCSCDDFTVGQWCRSFSQKNLKQCLINYWETTCEVQGSGKHFLVFLVKDWRTRWWGVQNALRSLYESRHQAWKPLILTALRRLSNWIITQHCPW